MFDSPSCEILVASIVGDDDGDGVADDATDVDYTQNAVAVHSLGSFDYASDIDLIDDVKDDVLADDALRPVCRILHRQMRVCEIAPKKEKKNKFLNEEKKC